MKAPLPLQSPMAQMPGTLVRSWSSTWMKPRLSVATPARSRPRSSVFGRRPTAISRCVPTTSPSPLSESRLMAMPDPRLAMRMPCTPVRTSMPSSLRMSATAAETSSSSRAIRRGAISITVTSLPKRRKICANSSPM